MRLNQRWMKASKTRQDWHKRRIGEDRIRDYPDPGLSGSDRKVEGSMKKKKIMAAAAGLLCGMIAVISAVSGTASATAYMSDHADVNNQFVIGNNTTTVEEEFPTPTPVPPGEYVAKKVKVTNQGNVPCYIRVALSYSEDLIALENLDSENWETGEDGYYYYKHVVEVGSSTMNLFSGVTVKGQAEASDIRIDVYEESVQTTDGSKPYKDYKEAWAHYGGGGQT